jgi:alpha-1,2-mannosyltransferase
LLPLAVALALIGLAWMLLGLSVFPSSEGWAYDYQAYVDAAERLGQTGTLYARSSLLGGFEPVAQVYLYPPPLGIAVTPLVGLPGQQGATAWYLLHVGALILACALMPVRTAVRVASFGAVALGFAVSRDLALGNVSMLLLLPLVMGWRWIDRPAGSLALALAASVRVTFGIYLLWFLVRRAWRPLFWMLVGGAALVALSLPVVGIDGYRDYVTMLANVSDTADLGQNRHLTFTALRLGVPEEQAWLVLLPVYLLAVGAVVASRRRDPEVGFMVTAGAALLLAPLIWDHYLVLLLLPAAFLAERGRPWALVLPLLSWLPGELLPFVSLAALLLPFLARDREVPAGQARADPTVARPSLSGQAPV